MAALEEAVTEFNDKAEEFKREAASLVQVSRHAAALSADRRREWRANTLTGSDTTVYWRDVPSGRLTT